MSFCAYSSKFFAATSAAIILFLLFQAAATIALSSDVVGLTFLFAEPQPPIVRCEDPCARLVGARNGEGAGCGVCGVSRDGVTAVLWRALRADVRFSVEFPCLRELKREDTSNLSVKLFHSMTGYPMEMQRCTSRRVGARSALLPPSFRNTADTDMYSPWVISTSLHFSNSTLHFVQVWAVLVATQLSRPCSFGTLRVLLARASVQVSAQCMEV